MYYVYILQSKITGKLYKGSCVDLKERLRCHNSKKVKTTKNGIPWKLIYYEAFVNKKDARCEELFFKNRKRQRVC